MKKLTALLVAFVMLINCAPIISSAATELDFKLYEGDVRSFNSNDYAKAGGMLMFTTPDVPSGYSVKYFNNDTLVAEDDISSGLLDGTVALRIKPGQNSFTARMYDNKNRRVAVSKAVSIFGYTYKTDKANEVFDHSFAKTFEHKSTYEDISISAFESDIEAYKDALASNTVTPEIKADYDYAAKVMGYDEANDTYSRDPYYTHAKTSGDENYVNVDRRPIVYDVEGITEISIGVFLTQVPISPLNLTGWLLKLDGITQVNFSKSNFYVDTDGVLYIHKIATDIVLKPHQWYDIKVYIDNSRNTVDCYVNDVIAAKNLEIPFFTGTEPVFDAIDVYPPYANSLTIADSTIDPREHIIYTLPEVNTAYELSTDTEYIPGEDSSSPDEEEEIPEPSGDYVSRYPVDHEFTVKDGLLIVEAEDLAVVNPSFNIYVADNVQSASNGKMLYWSCSVNHPETGSTTGANPSSVENSLPDFRLNMYVENPGTYNMWIRFGRNGKATSSKTGWFTSLNGGSTWSKISPGSPGSEGFKWIATRNIKLNEGRMDFLFSHFYNTGCFDKIIITDNLAWTPTDKDSVPDGTFTAWYDEATFNGQKVVPPEGHPRLFIREDNISNIWNAIQNEPDIKRYYDRLTHKYALEYLPRLHDRSSSTTAALTSISAGIKARSLVYLMNDTDTMALNVIGGNQTDPKKYGRDTIEWAKIWVHTAPISSSSVTAHRAIGAGMCAIAVMYDWHYDLLTEDEKQFFIGKIKEWATYLEYGYPSDRGYNIYGHQHEYQNYRDLLQCGAAIYDEFPEMWNTTAGRVFNISFPARAHFLQSGNHSAGTSYGEGIRSESEFLAAMLLAGWGYKPTEIFGQGFEKLPMRFIHSRLPYGRFANEGEYAPSRTIGYDSLAHLASYGQFLFADTEYGSIYHNEWLEQLGLSKLSSSSSYLYAFDLLMARNLYKGELDDLKGDYDLGDNLPRTYISGFPVTQMYARTNWQMGMDSDAAHVMVQGREKTFDAHIKPDIGSFQIYYKGYLTNQVVGRLVEGDSGSGQWKSSLDRNFNRRTISHNCMTVYDPEEVMLSSYYYDSQVYICSNDGGMDLKKWQYDSRYSNYVSTDLDYALSELGYVADTKGKYVGPNEVTPEFSYLKTDLGKAYGGHHVRKSDGKTLKDCIVDEFTVYDKTGKTVITDPEKKLEVNNRIKVSDVSDTTNNLFLDDFEVVPKLSDYKRSSVFVNLDNEKYPAAFIVYDKIDSTNASFEKNFVLHANSQPVTTGNQTVITRTDNGCNGKLVVNTLLPENPDIELIGGIDQAGWVDGVNYALPTKGTFPDDTTDTGTGDEEDTSGGTTDDESETAASDVQFPLGGWRIEVSPSVESMADHFLHAMYVTDADGGHADLPMTKFEDTNFLGVTVLDKFVAFAKNGQPMTASFAITIPDNNNGADMSVLLTDVGPGLWSVKKSSGSANLYQVTEEENALCFKGKPGTYVITVATSGTPTEIDYPEMTSGRMGDFHIYTTGDNGGAYSLRYQKYPTKLVNGNPMVCVDDFFALHNATVTTENSGKKIVIASNCGNYTTTLTVGSTHAVLNGSEKTLSIAPTEIDGRVYVNPVDLTDGVNFTAEYRDTYKTLRVVMKAS